MKSISYESFRLNLKETDSLKRSNLEWDTILQSNPNFVDKIDK